MGVKVKIKLDGKDAKDMAKDSRVEAAFHEVMHNTPKIVKQTARKQGAKQAHKQEVAIALSKARRAGAKIPDASGSNYVSSNDQFVHPGGTPSADFHGSSRVPYVEAPTEGKSSRPDMLGATASLGTSTGLSSTRAARKFTPELIGSRRAQIGGPPEPEGPSHNTGDVVPLRMVQRDLNPVEKCRRQNNAVRDARTNLGRGKAGLVSAEEENNVRQDW